jgi:hypothetical protein
LSEFIDPCYAIFTINYKDKLISYNDGLISDELNTKCNEDFDFENTNISALYGQRKLSDKYIEVFMISDNLLNCEDYELIELVIFHEVCHFIEKTDKLKILNIEFSNDEIAVGKFIQDFANHINEFTGGWGVDINHNEIFGSILFHFIKQYDYDRRFILTSQAMIKNFLEDISKELSDV